MSFFEPYRDAFDKLDGNAIAALYCVPSAIADPSRANLVELARADH